MSERGITRPGVGFLPDSRWHRRALLVILLFCIVSRGGYVLYLAGAEPSVAREPDTPSYEQPAEAIAEHGRFDQAVDIDEPEFTRTPGYPLFLAIVWKVFGTSATAVLLVQVVLSALTVLLVYSLGARLWSDDVGLLAALLVTLEPLQFTTSGTLLTESITALLLVVAARVGYVALTRAERAVWPAAGLGLALAAATMVRPVTYYLLFLTAAVVAWRLRRDRWPWRRALAVLLAFAAPVALVIGGWQLRNHERVGSWRLSGIEGKNMYEWRAAGVVAEREGISLDDARERLVEKLGPIRPSETEGAYRGREYREGMEILRDHPGTTVVVTVRGLWHELFHVHEKLPRYLRMEEMSPPVIAAATATLVAFWMAAGFGVWLVWRRRRDLVAHVFVAGIALYVLFASAGPEAYGGRGERFRAPVIPLLVLYAALAVVELWRHRARRTARQEGITGPVGALLTPRS